MMNPFTASLCLCILVLLSLVVAIICYMLLGSSAWGEIWGFKVGGGLAAFILVYLLLDKTFKYLISLPAAKVKIAREQRNSKLRSDEISMIDIMMTPKYTQVFWDSLIDNSTKVIDIFAIHTSIWIDSHIGSLRNFLSKSGAEVNFVLLDPDSTATQTLQTKFDFAGGPTEILTKKINDSISRLKAMDGDLKGKIRIYLQPFPPAYAAYRFDNRIVIIDYKQTPGLTNEIPAFIYSYEKNRGLFDYYVNDIESFKSHNSKYSKLCWQNHE